MSLTYDQILGFCTSLMSEKLNKSDASMLEEIDKFQSFEACDRDALLNDLKKTFSVLIGEGGVLVDEGHIPWLESKKASIDPFYWGRYQKLLQKQGFNPLPLAEMDRVSDRILGLMDDPDRPGPWDRRGMVLGHVQSGKTANYIGLINKASDAGYKVIIVIAGIHNSLRNQTQRRIDEGFRGIASADIKKSAGIKHVGVGKIDPNREPSSFTTTLKDFSKAAAEQVGIPLSNLPEPVVFVIKKNPRTLQALVDWLQQYSGVGINNRIDEPLLLIDDEADNASINTSKNTKKVTRINSLIRELLDTFTRSSYVGYTATPFANIFVDPLTDDEMLGRDLFPRDFLVSLDAPTNYHGPAKIFDGEEPSAVIRYVEDAEVFIPAVHKSTFSPDALPPSLETAIRTFLLTRAIRIIRGQATKHSSMLVNISQYVQPQKTVTGLILGYLNQIRNQVQLYGGRGPDQGVKYPLIASLKDTFFQEFGDGEVTWGQLYPLLWEAIAPVQVLTINGKSADTLNYEQHSESGLHVIAVGGNSLSRGLTLEGLSTSYLTRNSKQYDTLMQMGRWFGYRPGYEDLCRLWLPPIVANWYEHITEATEELRSDVISMQRLGATPREFGLRVRSHPDTLLVTARNKMGTSEIITAKMSLEKTFVETARLVSAPDARKRNLTAAKHLSHALVNDPQVIRTIGRGTQIFTQVPALHIVNFLKEWVNLPASYRTQPEQLIEFISARPALLGSWDIAFPGVAENSRLVDSEYSAFPIGRPKRTVGDDAFKREIKVGKKLRVISPGDEQIGLSERELIEARQRANDRGLDPNKYVPGVDIRKVRSRPLMLIHYLDLLYQDKGYIFDEPVIAWSMSFPDSTDRGEPVEYRVNRTYLEELLEDYGDEEDFDFDDF